MNHLDGIKHLHEPATDMPGTAFRVRHAPSPHSSQQVDWKQIHEQRQAAAQADALRERAAAHQPEWSVPVPFWP